MARRNTATESALPVGFTKNGATGTLRLTDSVTIDVAELLLETSRRAAESGLAIRLAVDSLARIDLSALQILMALRREVEAAGRSFEVVAPIPSALAATFAAVGVVAR